MTSSINRRTTRWRKYARSVNEANRQLEEQVRHLFKSSKSAKNEIGKLNCVIDELKSSSSLRKDESLLFNEQLNNSVSCLENESLLLSGRGGNAPEKTGSPSVRKMDLR